MKGLIAYFDVLGFSNLIREEKFLEKREKYAKILNDAVNRNGRNLDYIAFSDSVIIKSESITEKELLDVCKAVSEISFQLLLELELPLRGCISCGDFTWDVKEGNSIISGAPILDAINWEKKQNWMGVILSPRIVDKFRDLQEKTHFHYLAEESDENIRKLKTELAWKTHIQVYDEIPLSDSAYNYEGFVILPRNPESTDLELQKDILEYRRKLRFMTLLAPDTLIQTKYTHSAYMIESINARCHNIMQRYVQNYFKSEK